LHDRKRQRAKGANEPEEGRLHRSAAPDYLLNSTTHLRLIVENSPDLIATLAPDATIQFMNHTLPQFKVEEVVGTSAFDYIHRDDLERYKEVFRQVVETGEPREMELLSDGPAWWLSRFVPIRADDGKVSSVLVIATDVTERKRAERALRESESRFRTLADSTSAGIFVIQDTRIVYANRAAETLTGYPLREMSQMSFWELAHPEHRERSRAWGLGRQQGLSVPGRYEARLLRKDGGERWVDYSASVFDLRGAPAILGTAVDITDRKLAEEERRRLETQVLHAQKLESLGVMASGIAHDFNNLLTGILGSASLAALKVPPDSPAAQQLARVLSAAEKATELTSKMLAYAGKGEFVLVPSDLNRIIEGVLPLVRTSLGRSTTLQLALAPNLPSIEADATQIEQVVVNLLTNASEALAKEIVVRTGAMAAGENSPSASVFLEVRDDGSGMDEETKTRIFDPFFSTKFTGRGLGLSVVSGIVSRHRGKIRVESAPQRGTTFTVLFPSMRPDEVVEGQPAREQLAKLSDR
jgi:PAS domain S-box-containing protein